MITLDDFNYRSHEEVLTLLHPCVAIPGWAEALVAGRPYPSRDALFDAAQALTKSWDEHALTEALSAHPRIGEKPMGAPAEAARS